MPSINLTDCVQELQDKWPSIVKEFKKVWPKCDLVITCTHRTPEEQFELYKQGRKHDYPDNWTVVEPESVVTYKDGTKNPSRHNLYPSQAVDVVVVNEKGYKTYAEVYYECLVPICKKLGLT